MTALLAAASVGERPAVSLAELDERAALLRRVDRKYVLDGAAVEAFLDRLEDARVLEIAGRRRFGYRSTYLDTAGLNSFHDAARKRPRRGKVRLRTYLDSGEAYLEVKTRRRGYTEKSRLPWASDRLDAAASRFVAERLDAGGVRLAGLAPVLDVTYDRTTLLLPDAARLTIDTGLRIAEVRCRRDERWAGFVVVESKSAGPPSTADRLLWRLGHRPATISKYATGLAALRPELPRNRWHRLLELDPFAAGASWAA